MQAPPPQPPPSQPPSSPQVGRLHLVQHATPTQHLDQHSRKPAKPKDLSHVPCKFFKANSCTAGDACPFSHDLPVPGTSKPVCQWFAKGNCKFGHKCALAHVLPGQPMSFDRKNKRAAQQALRDAQATADGGVVTATHATAQSPRLADAGGLVQTLRQSVDAVSGRPSDYLLYQQPVPSAQLAYNAGTSQAGDLDAIFGSPDGVAHGTPASSPPVQHRTLQHNSPHSPLHFSALSQGPTVPFIAPASSGLSHHFGSASNGRSSVAAHAMLSEQARRLSSTSESLSPPRIAHLSHTRVSVSFQNGSPAMDLGTSPPLAVPGAGAGAAGASIFGTSPFSGSRGLFIPSSYDSNEDAFPRSPPVRSSMLLGDMQRSGSGMTLGAPWQDAIADEYDDDEGDAEPFDEGFLPSSLNDLLTPEEMQRRTRRANGAGPSSLSSPSPFDPFLNSKSVPADLFLAAGKPSSGPPAVPLPHPSIGTRSASAMATTASFGLLSSSVEGHNPSAVPYQPGATNAGSLLAQSRTREATVVPASPAVSTTTATPPTSSLLSATLNGAHLPPPGVAGIYSASFSNAALHHAPSSFAAALGADNGQQQQQRYPQTGLSPGTNASLALPGSSLPGGLAAGLSRLHLVPPAHTGETPPSASYATAAAAAGTSPSGGGVGAHHPYSALGRQTSAAPGGGGIGSPLAHELHLHAPSAARGGSGGGTGTGTGTPEPLSAATERPPLHGGRGLGLGPGSGEGSAEEEDGGAEGEAADEIQFDMEVA
ncbi:hypothetical protein JCM3770_000447 [Rhodotorula araucariae]